MIAPSPLSTLFPYTTLFRSNGCQAGDEKKSGHHRHHFGNASVVCNFSSVPAVINHAHQQEEGSCGESVIHHLDDCALNSNRIECKKDRKSTRLRSSHVVISYAVCCLNKK